MAIANGYSYTKNAVSRLDPNVVFYHCVFKQKYGCPGLLHAVGDSYTEMSEHCHESVSQQALVNATKCKESLVIGATLCGDDVSTKVNEEYDRLHPDEKALLPQKSSLHRMVRNRKNKGGLSKLPEEPEDFDDLGMMMIFFLSLSVFLLFLLPYL